MNQTKISLIWVLLAFYFSMAIDCYSQSRAEEDRNWVRRNFTGIREELFPLEKRPGTSIGYRSYRDLFNDDREYSFVFIFFFRNQTPKVTVTIRTPEEFSIITQIITLHRQYPELSAAAIKSRLKIKEIELEENKCPALRTQYNKFYRLVLQTRTEEDRKREMKGVTSPPTL
jgi:hypothetical protein